MYLETDRDNTSAERTENTFIEKVNSYSNFMYGKENCQPADTSKFINVTLIQPVKHVQKMFNNTCPSF